MSGLPWYKCFPRDFNDGMVGLSLEERGAYITILNVIYARGAPIQDDAGYFKALLCCSSKAWTKIRASLIVKRKLFEVNFNGELCLMNRRAADEIGRRGEISEIRSDAGHQGGLKTQSKRRENNDLGKANEQQTPSNVQAIQIQTSEEDANASLSATADATASPKYPEPFETAWKAYPHVKGRSSKSKAFAVWRRLPQDVRNRLPLAIARFAREGREPKAECGARAFERWLQAGLYADWMADPQQSRTTPADPALQARRVQHYRDTGEWKLSWGDRPAMDDAA